MQSTTEYITLEVGLADVVKEFQKSNQQALVLAAHLSQQNNIEETGMA